MKLAEWAKQQGVSYKTAYRWFRSGILPVPCRQLPTGTILVEPPKETSRTVVLYARVSSADQKTDLDRQLARLVRYADDSKMVIGGTITEIGSGLNGKRPKLIRALKDRTVGTILVEHRDRLARFGSEYIEAALQANERRLVIVDKTEMKDDLVQDMIDVLTSFCARLYGRRAAKNRAERAMKAAAG